MSKTFAVILRQVAVPAGEPESFLARRAAARIGCPPEAILDCRPVRRSLDARKRRGKAVMVYHLRLEMANRWRKTLRKAAHLDLLFEPRRFDPVPEPSDPVPAPGRARPVVVGAGPAGLFAALRLARAGWRPLLLERGDDTERRRTLAADFWRRGGLDPESNVFFGVGGAGLFSDGKLNTRHKDRHGIKEILAVMVEAGAPERIMIDAEPHVGSDKLADMVERLVREIGDRGGEIRLRARLTGLSVEAGRLRGVLIERNGATEEAAADACVMAIGHSARDTYATLLGAGAAMTAKPFAIGLRAEAPQDAIDASQRGGKFTPAPGEAASFRLSLPPAGNARPCYTFCMCPGGQVIACASEPGRLCVNGMSYQARAGEWGNAAFLVPVSPEDFGPEGNADSSVLAGIAFQRRWEEKAFAAGLPGGAYAVPASRLADFAAGRAGTLPERRGVARAAPADLRRLLPDGVAATLARAIPAMLSRLRRVDLETVMLYGVETRTSSPVRMERDAAGESPRVRGLFPAGEGAGYAGGIATSALDGWKAAAAVIRSV